MDKTPLADAKTGAEHSKIKTHFARIIVSWGIDNPYYSILYYDPADDKFHQGFGSRCLDNVIKWLSEEFEIIGGVFWCEPVRHGRWVWHEDWGHPSISEPPDLYDTYWICSACGTDLLQYLKSHFPDIPSYTECSGEVPTLERCPCCGAKMDGGKDNDCK